MSVLVVLGAVGYVLNDLLFPVSRGYELTIRFGVLEGLEIGSQVKISGGLPVGRVKRIETSDEGHDVHVLIEPWVKIPATGVRFSIYTTGMMGAKYVNIFYPTSEPPFLQGGERFSGISPGNLNESLIFFTKMLDEEPPPKEKNFARLVEESRDQMKELNQLTWPLRQKMKPTIQELREKTEEAMEKIQGFFQMAEKSTNFYEKWNTEYRRDFQRSLDSYYNMSTRLSLALRRGQKKRTKMVGQMLFEETQFDKILEQSRYLKEILKDYSDEPYNIINSY